MYQMNDPKEKHLLKVIFLTGIYLFKVNNGNNRTMCEIRSKLTKKIPERHHSDVHIVNFE